MSISRRLKAAKELNEVKSILSETAAAFLSDDAAAAPSEERRAFFKSEAVRLQLVLLNDVTLAWVPLMSAQDRRALFDPFFLSPRLNPVDALESLSSAFAGRPEKTHAFKLDLASELIAAWLERFPLGSVIRYCWERDDARPTPMSARAGGGMLWGRYVACLCLLPDRMANAYEGHPKLMFGAKAFFGQLANGMLECMRGLKDDAVASYITALLVKTIRIGYIGYVVDDFIGLANFESNSSVAYFFGTTLLISTTSKVSILKAVVAISKLVSTESGQQHYFLLIAEKLNLYNVEFHLLKNLKRLLEVTAECFYVKCASPIPLSFDLPPDKDVLFLRDLANNVEEMTSQAAVQVVMSVEEEQKPASLVQQDAALAVDADRPEESDDEEDPDQLVTREEQDADLDDDAEVDSDDDELKPLQTADEMITPPKKKGPRYIRECLEWLKDTENLDKIETVLEVLPEVIEKTYEGELGEVMDALFRRLMTLKDAFNLEGFDVNRQAAMITLGVKCPKETAQHLVNEVFTNDDTILQRKTALTYLALIAIKLSTTHPVIERAPGTIRKRPMPVRNPFSDHAASFFFPLVRKYNKMRSARFMREVSLFSHFLTTAAVILQASVNTPECRAMSRELFDLLWSLDYRSQDASVRNAILFGYSAVVTSLPKALLMAEFGPTRNNDAMTGRAGIEDVLRFAAENLERETDKGAFEKCARLLTLTSG
ncbi:TEL2, telomere maintenance protein 2 [Irineochytrium annulatum]|nr:TEL2, telomere maintenance protein 2 [Irineochytrium annulatum]